MKTTFGAVKEGRRFSTPFSKRLMTCVKVGPTEVGARSKMNAVILLDHTGKPEKHDLGELLCFRRSESVEAEPDAVAT